MRLNGATTGGNAYEPMRAFVFFTCFLCGCASVTLQKANATPWPGRCELPQTSRAEHLTNGDYARLLPFRSYVRVARVGPYVEHVTIWYGCLEGNVAHFEVSPTDVRLVSRAWGGVAVAPKDVASVPSEGRVAVDRVRAWLEKVAPDARISLVRYDGAYREVTLVALEPMDLPGSQARSGASVWVTFGADEALSRVVHSSGGASFAFGTLCGRECGEPPKWLSIVGPAARTMSAMRAATVDPSGSQQVREALEQLRLSRTVSLDALLANQDESRMLPHEGLPPVLVSLRLFAKRPGTAPTTVAIPIDIAASARGVASGEVSLTWASRHLIARARISIDAATPDGPLRAPLRLEVELDDGNAPSVVLSSRFDAIGIVYAGRLALASVARRADTMGGDLLLDASRQLWVSSPELEVALD